MGYCTEPRKRLGCYCRLKEIKSVVVVVVKWLTKCWSSNRLHLTLNTKPGESLQVILVAVLIAVSQRQKVAGQCPEKSN